jgi:hypothetical protein
MIGTRRAQGWKGAAWMLAVGLLTAAAEASAFDGMVPSNSLRTGWSPSRDDAVVVENLPATRGVETIPEDSVLSHSLMMRRPQSLSRPAPSRTRTTWTGASVATEALPSVIGAPSSPEGLTVPAEGSFIEDGASWSAGGGECCNSCGPDCCGNWRSCGPVPPCCLLPCIPLDTLEFFSGVQGFTGPANRGGSGSFGFHEGFNWGTPLCGYLAWQWGVNWTQNNFDGNFLTNDQRNQIFLTAGMFRRVDWGLQGGLVVDYFHDEWDYSADLLQLRGELSCLYCGCNEVGFWFTAGVNDATNQSIFPVIDQVPNPPRSTLAVTDLYAFFYRRQFCNGGQGRIYGGFSSNQQGLVGGDIQLPINPNWSLRSSFLYLPPESGGPGFLRDSWNVGISLVWTPCARPACGSNYSRPLFNVADNGSFATHLAQ